MAVLVPEAGAEIDLAAIEAAARAGAGGFKRPRHVVVLEALPRNTMGKGAEGRAAQDLRRGLSPEGWVMVSGQGGGESRDSNPGWTCAHNGFRDRPVRPLRHLSALWVRVSRAGI